MQVNIEHRPSYALAVVGLAANESVVAEGGAMVSMDSHIGIQTSRKAAGGGILKSLKRAALGGESFFMNTYTAGGAAGHVTFAPTLPGDIAHLQLNNQTYIIQSSSYMASAPGIALDTSWGGFKTFFGGEGLFMLTAKGSGDLIINAFGGIHEMNINGPYIIDTGHIVAFEESLNFEVKRVGSWLSTFFSGEGLVCEFNGQGKLYIQTRNPKEFGSLVGGKLPPREA